MDQASSASKWHRADTQALKDLSAARATITSLHRKVTNLTGQVSAQANAKAKALDQNTVLRQVVTAEATVSSELNACVTDMDMFLQTLTVDMASGGLLNSALTSAATRARTVCNQAKADNQTLQSALKTATGG